MKKIVRLSDFFQRYRSEVITVIGSGGKTSLIWFLARCFARDESTGAGRRVLVTTTTKMGAPDFGKGLFDHLANGIGLETPEPGITFAGDYGSRKTTAPPPAVLSSLIRRFDVALIEGDGSKTLPLKGWADYEPVVAPETTVTVGIIPLWPLGMRVTGAIVHRLPLFSRLTGAQQSDILTPAHIAAAITGARDGSRGLFACARGRRILFFNQVEDDTALRHAQEITGLLPAETSLEAVIAGSVKHNEISVLLPDCGPHR
jgi:probable selenium-dependent hydroxylase accessory protein YqeC